MTGGARDELATRELGQEMLALGPRFRERYDIGRVIGRGGMGVVYEAFDRVRGARIALKTMRNFDAAALYRFKNEFRSLADVSHTNLVALYELESEGGRTFFTMEHIEGTNFLGYISGAGGDGGSAAFANASTIEGNVRGGPTAPSAAEKRTSPLDVGRLRAALAQLVEGIAVLHASGKLHRDLKPSNVLVTAGGRVVVLDFGLVASFGRELMESVEHSIVGTPEYMSPEQAAGADLTEASDWYSVGVMLYQALTGRLPYDGPPLKILLQKQQVDPPRPRELVTDAPEDLEALCVELLRRDPQQRPTENRLREALGSAPATRVRAIAPPTMPTIGATFIGRERHMQELATAFESARQGRAVVAYVHGSSGMGKSLLVRRWLDALAQSGDAVVLSGRCYERESVPYKALDSIVDALSRHLRQMSQDEVAAVLPTQAYALTRVFPVLGRVEAVSAALRRAHEIPDPHELRRRAATALRDLFERMTARHPVVLWIDDLQWGDIDSAALIEELLRPPDPPAVLLIVTYRTEDASSPLVAAMRADDGRDAGAIQVREIDVGALEPEDARRLALVLLGKNDAVSHARASIVATESRGNPFFVEELVRHVTDGQELASLGTASAVRLDDVLYGRVQELPEDARRLLEVIAVAGAPLARPVAAAATELDGEREATALAVLRAAKLVRSRRSQDQYELETYHDRIRETVTARLDAAARSRLHLRVAHALVARGNADPEALVVHFQEGKDGRKAAEFAARAAEKAVEALAFERAASLWRSALDLPSISPDAARALRRKLGDALNHRA